MRKEGFSKRGQRELSIGTLLLIVLGVIVLIILVIGFTQGFDFIFGKIKILPGQDLQAVVTSCEIAAGQGLKADYCIQFKEVTIDGVTEHLNCQDDRVQNSKSSSVEDKIGKEGCEKGDKDPQLQKCISLVNSKGYDGKEKVNGNLVGKLAAGGDASGHCKNALGNIIIERPADTQ